MKILHICLACFYIDGYNYQENVLPRINKEDGHDVRILASTETYVDNQHLGYIEPSEYVTEYGVPIKRLPYVKVGTHFMTVKLRKYSHVYEEIAAFAPDVILAHNLSFWSVLDVIRYKKEHPEVRFYADTHTASYNSGGNWLSLNVLHRLYYRYLSQKAIPYLDKYFYTTEECREFSAEYYGMPDSLMEFYPLGGNIPPDKVYADARIRRREELGLAEDELLFVHSGKLDELKRTDELLRAFAAVPDLKAKLAIIGSIPEDRKELITSLMEADSRVTYLGWKSAPELLEFLCACDLYCQPGSMSATMQNAVCAGCAVLSYPHPSYVKGFDYGNILWAGSQADMEQAFRQIQREPASLDAMKENSKRCARELLDYRKLAARLYE